MAKVFFVSDVHIRQPHDTRHTKFLGFLDYVLQKNATHLFIIGDLFEFLYGRPDYIVKKYNDIFRKLEILANSGTKIYYLYGNHDFDFDSMTSFVSVKNEISSIDLGGKKVSVFHGDGIDPSDIKYRLLKSFLRGPMFKIMVSVMPDVILYGVAGLFSNLSRNINLSTRLRKGRGWLPYRDKAIQILKNSEIDTIVYAHTHIAELSLIRKTKFSQDSNKFYINTGFFGRHGTYCMMDAGIVSVGVFEN